MLRTATLTAFVATTNPPRSKVFYQDVLGLPLLSEDRFALLFEANGIQLRIQKLEKLVPQTFTVLGWQVPDVRTTVSELSRRGVSFERYASMQQDDLGIWQAPSGAMVAWFKDPDGNLLSVTQSGTA
jgi:catechol 2,3-dioxygenase-like lactoylglutathione lyase family enzyme